MNFMNTCFSSDLIQIFFFISNKKRVGKLKPLGFDFPTPFFFANRKKKSWSIRADRPEIQEINFIRDLFTLIFNV